MQGAKSFAPANGRLAAHEASNPSAAWQGFRPSSQQALSSVPILSCSPAENGPGLQNSNLKQDRAAAILHVQLGLQAAADQDVKLSHIINASEAFPTASASAFPACIMPSSSRTAGTRQGEQSSATIPPDCGQPSHGLLHAAAQHQPFVSQLPQPRSKLMHDQGAAVQTPALRPSVAPMHLSGRRVQATYGQHAAANSDSLRPSLTPPLSLDAAQRMTHSAIDIQHVPDACHATVCSQPGRSNASLLSANHLITYPGSYRHAIDTNSSSLHAWPQLPAKFYAQPVPGQEDPARDQQAKHKFGGYSSTPGQHQLSLVSTANRDSIASASGSSATESLGAARTCFNAQSTCSSHGRSITSAPVSGHRTSGGRLYVPETDAAEGLASAAVSNLGAGPPKLAKRRRSVDKAQLRQSTNRLKASYMVGFHLRLSPVFTLKTVTAGAACSHP